MYAMRESKRAKTTSGMMQIDAIISKLKKAKETLAGTSFQKDIIQNNSVVIENLNRDQLRRGITSEGGVFPDYKSKNKNGPIKWRDTGKYYSSLKTGFFDSGFFVGSTDNKDKFIEGRFGPVKGLNNRSIDLLRGLIKTQAIQKVKMIVNV